MQVTDILKLQLARADGLSQGLAEEEWLKEQARNYGIKVHDQAYQGWTGTYPTINQCLNVGTGCPTPAMRLVAISLRGCTKPINPILMHYIIFQNPFCGPVLLPVMCELFEGMLVMKYEMR